MKTLVGSDMKPRQVGELIIEYKKNNNTKEEEEEDEKGEGDKKVRRIEDKINYYI